MIDLLMCPVSLDECLDIIEWRLASRAMLRTPEMSTPTQQKRFWESLQAPGCPHRYWAFRKECQPKEYVEYQYGLQGLLLAVGGLTNICFENRNAEISLIVNPKCQRQGIGTQCVEMILDEAFNRMGLKTVYGEAYHCNPGLEFWQVIGERYNAFSTDLPNRKFWNHKFFMGWYFSIDEKDWHD